MWEELFKENFPVIASWSLGIFTGFCGVDTIKRIRRDAKQPKPSTVLSRLYAFAITSPVTYFSGTVLFHAPIDQASFHAVLAGVACPMIVSIGLAITKERNPALYERLKVTYPSDGKDPNVTGEF